MGDANILVPYLPGFERRRDNLFAKVEGTYDSARNAPNGA